MMDAICQAETLEEIERTYASSRAERARIAKSIVIKLGGSALDNPSTLSELALTVKGYRARGYQVVLVHGGGPAINQELVSRGISWTFVNGQRRTTSEMIDAIDDVLSRQVNSRVVEALRSEGVPATGLSGCANHILRCQPLNEDLGLVGRVEAVDTTSIRASLAKGHVPVIAPVGRGLSSELKFNVNADWAATKIATALGVTKLVFLTDQRGILDGERQLVRSATPGVLKSMIATGVVSGGMCAKVLAMISALEHGVREVRVLNAAESSGSLRRVSVGTSLKVMRGHAS